MKSAPTMHCCFPDGHSRLPACWPCASRRSSCTYVCFRYPMCMVESQLQEFRRRPHALGTGLYYPLFQRFRPLLCFLLLLWKALTCWSVLDDCIVVMRCAHVPSSFSFSGSVVFSTETNEGNLTISKPDCGRLLGVAVLDKRIAAMRQ